MGEESKEMTARIFLARRSLGIAGYLMKITGEVRKFAAEQKISEEQAFQVGLEKRQKILKKQAPKFTPSRNAVMAL